MSKSEFLNELEESLRGEVSETVIQENLRYYRDYIDGEVRKGSSESQVIQMLGSGRIIAKTVIEAHGNGNYDRQENRGQAYQSSNYSTKEEAPTGITWKMKVKWGLIAGIIILLLIGILGVVLHVVWALLPFILIALIVYYFTKK